MFIEASEVRVGSRVSVFECPFDVVKVCWHRGRGVELFDATGDSVILPFRERVQVLI